MLNTFILNLIDENKNIKLKNRKKYRSMKKIILETNKIFFIVEGI